MVPTLAVRALPALSKITYLPAFVMAVFQGMPGVWKSRHRLLLCWRMVMPALFPGRKTLADLARWTPREVPSWRWRRMLKASYWDSHARIAWWGQQVLSLLPPPADGVLTLTGDGRHGDTRGAKNPLVQQGRQSEPHAWFFGMRFVLLIVRWDGWRFPVACRLIRPTSQPLSRTENALCREMAMRCTPPSWASAIIVAGDAAYGSHATMQMVRQRTAEDPARTWGCGCALARTGKTGEGKAIKDLGTHGPRKDYLRTWVPRMPARNGRQSGWLSSKRVCLRPMGAVTVVLSRPGRNVGPQHTQILGTTLTELTPRYGVVAYQKRWAVEHINRALQADRGMGAHQGSGEETRREHSFGIAVLASVFLIRLCHQEISPGRSWSVSQLQHTFRLRVITNQGEHHVNTRMPKTRKVA